MPGVIKMDFLGLKTLSILKTALVLIQNNHDVKINLDDIPLGHRKLYSSINEVIRLEHFNLKVPECKNICVY